jgi:hypothetical protein
MSLPPADAHNSGPPHIREADYEDFHLLTLAFAALPGFSLTPGAASPGDLVWEDRLDLSSFEQAFAVASLNHAVFVAGFAGVFRDGVNLGRDFIVRAYDDRSGALIWQDRLDRGSDEFASGVVTDQERVFVSGTAFVPGRGHDWIVRAYAADTGTLLWQSLFDLAGRSDFSRGTAIATGSGLLFVGGYGVDANGNQDWIVRAYEVRTGALAWQDRVDSGGSDGVRSLAAKAGTLFAGGWGSTATISDVLVRAHDARSGALRWEHRSSAPQSGFTFAWRVVADGERVFVGADRLLDDGGFHTFLVQALDAINGTLLWQDAVDKGGGADYLYDLDVHEGRVFAVGYGGAECPLEVSPLTNCNSLVRAYDATSGILAWELELDASGTRSDDLATNVTASHGMVFVFSQQPPLLNLPGLLRCRLVARASVRRRQRAVPVGARSRAVRERRLQHGRPSRPIAHSGAHNRFDNG